jgi:spermidine synthase
LTNVDSTSEEWLATHGERVTQKIAWLQDKPKGTIWERRSALHRILVYRENGVIRMYFVDPRTSADELNWSGAMSALKLDDPFDLSPTPYNQAMMLTLLWQPRPQRVYVAGFAGGRIPLMFYHYFPRAIIESTDIDSDVAELAERFFGVHYDERQRLYIEDGRQFLERRKEPSKYDFIFLDVFRGMGFSPPHLATADFYHLCKQHLAVGGVVAVNLVESDPVFGPRVATLASCFEQTYVQLDRTIVLYGTDGASLSHDDIVQRAEALQAEHRFSFPFVERAGTVQPLAETEALRDLPGKHAVLTDAANGGETLPLLPNDPLFYRIGRNDLCPCGSGKKFKKCHGQV